MDTSFSHCVAMVCFVGIVSFLAAEASGSEDDGSSPQQLLTKAAEATVWTHNADMKLQFQYNITWSNILEGDKPRVIDGSAQILQSGDRLHLIRQNSGALGTETVITPQHRVYWVRGESVQYTESSSIIKDCAPIDRGAPELGWFLDGDFGDGIRGLVRLATIGGFGKIQPTVRDEQLGDLASRVVEVKGDLWDFRSWIVPSRSYNFAKYTFDCEASPKLKLTERHIVVDNVRYQQVTDGTWVIQGGRYTQRLLFTEPKREMQLEVNVDRTSIDLKPDFDKLKAFDLPAIPNGEPAQILEPAQSEKGQSGIKYMWKDGTVVPAYDPKLIDRIRRAVEDPGIGTAPAGGNIQ